MNGFRYVSVFSGIGGLEHPTIAPLLFCEQDSACNTVLRRRYQGIEVFGNIRDMSDPPSADVVAGGWPCQDLSSAGTLGGINARRSGLFFEMLRVAKASGATTLIGENVPNLLTINQGLDFQIVLDTLVSEGFPFVAWRVLNARTFGLPQARRRLFIVASTERERAAALHAKVPDSAVKRSSRLASGFYWTGGKRSICFSPGYAPALKIGATDNKGRAPVAIMLGDRVRKLTANEFLRLQGFENLPIDGLQSSTILRMAGNAVPVPMGHFVMEAVASCASQSGTPTSFGIVAPAGVLEDGLIWQIEHGPQPLADNLIDFVDTGSEDSLSPQAAAGLIVRSIRSGQPMPKELFDVLNSLAADRTGKLKASRGNSFEALDSLADATASYRDSLPEMAEYGGFLEKDDEPAEDEESDAAAEFDEGDDE